MRPPSVCGLELPGAVTSMCGQLSATVLSNAAYVSIRQHTSEYVSIRDEHMRPTQCHSAAECSIRQHTSAYVSIRQHTSEYVTSMCGQLSATVLPKRSAGLYTNATYVSIRQHTSAHVSMRQHTSAYVSIRQHTSAYISTRQSGCSAGHTRCCKGRSAAASTAYVSTRPHTSAYVSIRQHMSAHLRTSAGLYADRRCADVCWRMLTYAPQVCIYSYIRVRILLLCMCLHTWICMCTYRAVACGHTYSTSTCRRDLQGWYPAPLHTPEGHNCRLLPSHVHSALVYGLGVRQHTSAYVSIRPHTSAYVRIRCCLRTYTAPYCMALSYWCMRTYAASV
jgi:hypothetical protein